MARLADAAGAVIVAAVVTPFDFEGIARNRRGEAANPICIATRTW